MSTLREDLISIISVGANNISKVEKLEQLFKQQMLEKITKAMQDFANTEISKRKNGWDQLVQLRQEVEKL